MPYRDLLECIENEQRLNKELEEARKLHEEQALMKSQNINRRILK